MLTLWDPSASRHLYVDTWCHRAPLITPSRRPPQPWGPLIRESFATCIAVFAGNYEPRLLAETFTGVRPRPGDDEQLGDQHPDGGLAGLSYAP